MSQTVTTQAGIVSKITFHDDDHRPSWRLTGKGFSEITFQTHVGRKYLSIHAKEYSEDTERSRDVFITLYPPAAAELLKQLIEAFKR
jgi:hypothetical protein